MARLLQKNIIVFSPTQGIAQSPNVGFGDVRNIDIESTPGIAKLNNVLVKKSGTTVDAFVKWIVRDPDTPANIFALDSNGVLYKSADSGDSWSEISDRGGSGQGLMVKWGYVFVCEDTTIDVMKISDSSWTNNWQTIDTDSLWHPMLVSKNDGKIYGGAGQYVFSIYQLTTFVPGTAATYEFTQQALDLPDNYRIKCLAELGNNLMIGTWIGTNIYDFKVADIFPWDRSKPSYNQPIQIAENGVNAMINIKNQLFVLAGINGGVYRSDGYNAVQIAQIPQHIADLSNGGYLEPYPGAIMNHKGRLWFGVSGSGAIDGCGVYSLMQTSGGNILIFENEISTEEMGANDVVAIGSLLSISRDQYICSWQDDENSSYGIDVIDIDAYNYATTYQGYYRSPCYRTGETLQPFKFTSMEFHFKRKLRTNEGIKISYRIVSTGAFTEIGTYDYSTYSDILSKNIITELPTDVKACEQIELEIRLTGTTTTPQLDYLMLK